MVGLKTSPSIASPQIHPPITSTPRVRFCPRAFGFLFPGGSTGHRLALCLPAEYVTLQGASLRHASLRLLVTGKQEREGSSPSPISQPSGVAQWDVSLALDLFTNCLYYPSQATVQINRAVSFQLETSYTRPELFAPQRRVGAIQNTIIADNRAADIWNLCDSPNAAGVLP